MPILAIAYIYAFMLNIILCDTLKHYLLEPLPNIAILFIFTLGYEVNRARGFDSSVLTYIFFVYHQTQRQVIIHFFPPI